MGTCIAPSSTTCFRGAISLNLLVSALAGYEIREISKGVPGIEAVTRGRGGGMGLGGLKNN